MKLTDDQVRARLKALDEFKKAGRNIGVWDLIVNVSAGLQGEMADWPAVIQDSIMQAIVRDCEPKRGWSLKVVASGCFQDVPTEPCYIRVVVQEFPPPPKVH